MYDEARELIGFMKYKSKLLSLWLGISTLLVFHFNNCESYNQQNLYSPTPMGTSSPSASCSINPNSSACASDLLSAEKDRAAWTNLILLGNNSIHIGQNDLSITLGGTCFANQFVRTEIYFHVKNDVDQSLNFSNDPQDSCVLTGGQCQVRSSVHCNNGKWTLPLPISQIIYDNSGQPFHKNEMHSIDIEMVVFGVDGISIYRNPTSATAQVTLIPDGV